MTKEAPSESGGGGGESGGPTRLEASMFFGGFWENKNWQVWCRLMVVYMYVWVLGDLLFFFLGVSRGGGRWAGAVINGFADSQGKGIVVHSIIIIQEWVRRGITFIV